MKQIENNFAVSGFVGKDAEIRQFANASVARFSLAVSRQEKSGEETKRVSAFINVEAWRNNANTDSLAQITKIKPALLNLSCAITAFILLISVAV